MHPPPSPAQPNFTLMTVCTPLSRRYYSVYSVVAPIAAKTDASRALPIAAKAGASRAVIAIFCTYSTLIFNTAFSAAPQIDCFGESRDLTSSLLRIWHWQSGALTTLLVLIHSAGI